MPSPVAGAVACALEPSRPCAAPSVCTCQLKLRNTACKRDVRCPPVIADVAPIVVHGVRPVAQPAVR